MILSLRRFIPQLSLLLLASCAVSRKQVSQYHTSYTVIDTTLRKDDRMAQMLLPYKKSMDTAMNVLVGYSEVPLSKAQPECTMGNFMADAQMALALRSDRSVQVSILNYGGIRIPYLSPGSVTKGKLYEMMPFDNKLTIVEIPGKVMRIFCDHIAAWGGWPVAGISFRIKAKKAVDIRIQGEPLNEQLVYHTALSDYLANGGDNCDFLVDCKKTYYNIFIRDMLIDYLSELNSKGAKLNIVLEKRISYAE
ncbi:5'-nucleotidase C-terminal domain-containing protein [Taibaiella koreensis]|uniref:5'-nucleotidase C-terminal domain-containing protein n=1 Tax=Taibaiella koreensis TaxID=1268548 RepID=UPI000E5A024F|nr:5'-nucleotidase [Taibaiella koreensis]